MNNDKAKFILRSYRASGADARDPLFAEALDQASRDPELENWLAEERKLDKTIQAKLASVQVPASLQSDILAAANLTTSRTFWHRSRMLMAMAASLLVLVGGIMVTRHVIEPQVSLSAFPSVAASFVSSPFHLEKMAGSLAEMNEWMASKPTLSAVVVPERFQYLADEGVGCRSFSWRGQEVALLCFTLKDGRPAHFFVMDARSLPDAAGSGQPQVAQHGSWVTTTWVENDHAYVVATSGSLNDAFEVL